MSADAICPPSPAQSVSSTSLVEIKADTRLVLKAFLHHSLSISPGERPGRVGGGYREQNKYSASVKDTQRRPKDRQDSQDEESSGDEKKTTFKGLIKRLQPSIQRPAKDPVSDQSQNGSLEKDNRPKGASLSRVTVEEAASPSSTSGEEGSQRKQQKKKKKTMKKLKTQLSSIFKKKEKEKEKEKDEPRPLRPTTLPINEGPEPEAPLVSPTRPPEFYEELAETLGKIAQKSHSMKRSSPHHLSPAASPVQPPPASDKEALVQQLVQIISMEGDLMNHKIQSDSFLRSSLTRLSYPSFAKLLDTFASQEAQAPPLLPPASPTLRNLAVTMEVSRRVVTATGTQRMQGYAERYMENFAPWVKSQGGWEGIAQLEEILEYD